MSYSEPTEWAYSCELCSCNIVGWNKFYKHQKDTHGVHPKRGVTKKIAVPRAGQSAAAPAPAPVVVALIPNLPAFRELPCATSAEIRTESSGPDSPPKLDKLGAAPTQVSRKINRLYGLQKTHPAYQIPSSTATSQSPDTTYRISRKRLHAKIKDDEDDDAVSVTSPLSISRTSFADLLPLTSTRISSPSSPDRSANPRRISLLSSDTASTSQHLVSPQPNSVENATSKSIHDLEELDNRELRNLAGQESSEPTASPKPIDFVKGATKGPSSSSESVRVKDSGVEAFAKPAQRAGTRSSLEGLDMVSFEKENRKPPKNSSKSSSLFGLGIRKPEGLFKVPLIPSRARHTATSPSTSTPTSPPTYLTPPHRPPPRIASPQTKKGKRGETVSAAQSGSSSPATRRIIQDFKTGRGSRAFRGSNRRRLTASIDMDASSTKDAKSPSQDAVDELEGDGRHETISLEPDLDLAISSVLATKDPLDSSDFDPIEYINLIFPNEQSLATIDNVLTKLRTKIRRMDIEMRELVRSQTDAGQQTASDLRDAQKAITELYSNYERIREKAVQSEKMVQEITKDIKSLDQAKNNLTVSVIVLRRLHMLVSALDQLRGAVSRRQYTDAASLLQVVNQLLVHFKGFRSVDQIAVLLEDAAKLQVDLKRAIFGEFEGAFVGGTLRSQYQTLHEACRVVDVIGAETRQELVNWYCELQLKDYRNIFRINQEVAGLADVSRRYAWFKRLLKTYDDDHCAAFPNDWRVAEAASEKFCQDTRKDLSEQLAKADHNMDVKVLLQAIQTTVDFEGKLHKRFDPRDLEAEKLTEVEVNQAPPGSKFHKIISSCFDPYLRHYIDSQDKVLSDLLETYRSRPTATEEESVLASSTDLFYSYRQTLGAFAKLSTKKPFLDLCILFGKWLRNYADMLLSKLPSDEKKAIGNEDIRSICLIINTADYCAATTTQLEEKLVEKIDEEFRPSVNFNLERDGFVNVSGSGIRALVRGIENSIEPAFNTMLKKPWGTVEAVGDQSDYVNTIATTLQFSVGAVKQHFASNKYFRTFCDKFSESFLGRYYNNIFKCKPISEVGAEQMLLDTHALKTILLQMANIGAEPGTQPPSTYLKLLNKGVTKVEQLLKVVLRPYEPVEGIVETYLLLFNDYSIANFQKVLELKGLKRAEQQAVMEAFQRRIPPDGNKSVGDLAGAGASTNATAAALAAAGAKFNMRKFVAGMNIPASMKLG